MRDFPILFYSPLGKAVELDRVLPRVHGLCYG